MFIATLRHRESCAINGVIPVISMIASYEVAEAVRYLSEKDFQSN